MNWNDLIQTNKHAVIGFANGDISGRDFYNTYFKGTPNEARQLVRTRGVQESRSLARKALRRRGILN